MNHQKPAGDERRAPHQERRDHRACPRARSADAVFRHAPLRRAHQAHLHNQFSNQRGSNEELVVTELGQVGTQFDGFAHQTNLDSWYNCFKVSENATRSGFSKLGVEKVGMVMTRGVLIDVAALKGVDMLPDTYDVMRSSSTPAEAGSMARTTRAT
jgi:hypothetical protein